MLAPRKLSERVLVYRVPSTVYFEYVCTLNITFEVYFTVEQQSIVHTCTCVISPALGPTKWKPTTRSPSLLRHTSLDRQKGGKSKSSSYNRRTSV
jgi:hypothetical protein